MVSIGMMGGLVLLLADLTKQQHRTQKKAEIHVELSAMFNRIIRTLYDGQACNETLGVGSQIQDGRSIDYIRDKEGEIVFEINQKYGNRLLRMESITLDNVRIVSGSTGSFGEMGLKVVVAKLGKGITGHNKVDKTFPLSVNVNANPGGGFTLVNCHYTGNNLAEITSDVVANDIVPEVNTRTTAAKGAFCTMMGGTFVSATGTCSYSGTLPDPVAPSDSGGESGFLSSLRHFEPDVDRGEGPFCGQSEYICLRVYRHPHDCGIKGGSRFLGVDAYNRSACYIPDDAHGFYTATSVVSCDAARSDARAGVDPNSLATTSSGILPAGHFKAKIYCDENCSYDGSNWSMRCRLYLRGTSYKCRYECTGSG